MSTQIINSAQSFERPSPGMPLATSQRRLKVFIPYDGSETSDAVMNHLKSAGLPQQLEALVAVTQVWLPCSPDEITRAVNARRLKLLTSGTSSFVPALRDYEEQKVLSREADHRIRSMFPLGKVKTENMQDVAAVARDILRRAKNWGAELIILGSKTSPSPHITDYCGPALRVAQDAHCSVRIVRPSDRKSDAPVRIMIVVDGSDSTDHVAQAVAERIWPTGSEATIVVLRKNGPRDPDRDSETTLKLQGVADKLRAIGLEVTGAIIDGQPEDVLLNQARDVSADCIFIDSGDGSDRSGLCRVAQALVLGAHCSVEVLRTATDQAFKAAA